MKFNDAITMKIERLHQMHEFKSGEYGDTISEPFSVFIDANPAERIAVMLDTKLSRIKHSNRLKEDSLIDAALYILHLWELKFPEEA